MLVFFFGVVMFGGAHSDKRACFSPKPPHSWMWWELCSGQAHMHHNFRLKKRIKKRITSGHLIFSPDVGLLLTSSQESNRKVNPPTHVLWETIREYLELLLKNSFFVLRSQMLLQEAEKGKKKERNKTTESNWWKPVKIWPCCGCYSYLAGPKTQKASSGMALNTDWTRFLCQLLESCSPAPHISWAYSWKLSDLFYSLPGAWKMTCKHGGKAFYSQ